MCVLKYMQTIPYSGVKDALTWLSWMEGSNVAHVAYTAH